MSIFIFFVVLFLLILVHEFGHYIVAKFFKIRVDEFGIGFPPKAWGKKIGETEYTLNWLPIGGFVRIYGEDPTQEHLESEVDRERSFVRKPKYAQALVLVAGVTMNVILAYFLFVIAFMTGMPVQLDETSDARSLEDSRMLITEVMPESPASEILKPSDQILRISREGEELRVDTGVMPKDISTFVTASGEETLSFEVVRRDETLTVEVTPQKGLLPDEQERALAGFSMALVGIEHLGFFSALQEAGERTVSDLQMITVGLGKFFVDAVQGKADMAQVAGPVGMVGMVGDAASLGFTWLLIFTAIISLNLAVINLLPIPALDGGRLVFVLYEAVTRKTVKPSFAVAVNQIGFIFLLALMALVTVSDVVKLF